jgi:hypothetical protein
MFRNGLQLFEANRGICLTFRPQTTCALAIKGNWALTKKHEVDILCAYPLNGASGNQDENAFKNICAEHSAVHLPMKSVLDVPCDWWIRTTLL